MDKSVLTEIGLTEREAEVYLSLVELGSSSATEIIRKTGFHRAVVYDLLERLIGKGLVGFATKGRKKFFEEVAQSARPVIFYESPYRILKSLQELKTINYQLQTVVGRELTKKFETVYRGAIDQVLEMLQKDKVKGEFVVVVGRP